MYTRCARAALCLTLCLTLLASLLSAHPHLAAAQDTYDSAAYGKGKRYGTGVIVTGTGAVLLATGLGLWLTHLNGAPNRDVHIGVIAGLGVGIPLAIIGGVVMGGNTTKPSDGDPAAPSYRAGRTTGNGVGLMISGGVLAATGLYLFATERDKTWPMWAFTVIGALAVGLGAAVYSAGTDSRDDLISATTAAPAAPAALTLPLLTLPF